MITELSDRAMTCQTCGDAFVWTVGEQDYFRANNLVHVPERCIPCRAQKRYEYAVREAV